MPAHALSVVGRFVVVAAATYLALMAVSNDEGAIPLVAGLLVAAGAVADRWWAAGLPAAVLIPVALAFAAAESSRWSLLIIVLGLLAGGGSSAALAIGVVLRRGLRKPPDHAEGRPA